MGQDEWETAGRESHHRALLKAWSEKKDSWSGSGKHVKDNEIKYTMPSKGEELGNGVATVVEKIHYRSLPLARKLVRGHRYRPISELRKEAEIMEKIVHHHIGQFSSKPSITLAMLTPSLSHIGRLLHELPEATYIIPFDLPCSYVRFEDISS